MELATNGRPPFLGVEIVKHMSRLETKVYKKPTETGLLLHYQSHVDVRYKQSLLKTMLNRAFKLSSNWQLVHLECERLTETFSRLRYPIPLLQSTIRDFVAAEVSGDVTSKQTCDDKKAPVRMRSANSVPRQLGELSRKIGKDIHPVYTSRKIGSNIKPKESKPPLVNQQCVVYHFKCDLCDADYVGYTCRHLYQRIEEHKRSAIGKHVRDQHGRDPSDISLRFKILRKCQSKFDYLIYEMRFVKELKPTLNTQSDSIRAKLFL